MATTIIAVTSDQHFGSTVSLCPPRVDLDDGGHYMASKAQVWVWEQWLAYWEWIARLRDAEKAELYAEFNGDITDGDHHGTTQIISGNPTAQAAVVDAGMAIPLALGPDAMFFVRGTEAHVGKSACFEERIARGMLKDGRPVQGEPDTGNASWWFLRMEVMGVRLNFAHHGRMGTRSWTKPNVVLNLAADIFQEHAANGELHPHIAVRSHYHRHVDTYDLHPVRVIQTAAWQLKTAFVHKVAAENIADVGGHAIIIRDGECEVKNFVHRPSRGAIWKAA